jgi:hypothetical protein
MARFYTVTETATILGYSTNSIYKFLDQKRLKSTRGNSKQGRFRIPHTSIEEFMGTKLSEIAIARALAASTQVKSPRSDVTPRHLILNQPPSSPPKFVTKPSPTTATSTTPTQSKPTLKIPLGLKFSRLLILIALILTITETLTSPIITFSGQLLRISILTITILLAYQSGGALEETSHDQT